MRAAPVFPVHCAYVAVPPPRAGSRTLRGRPTKTKPPGLPRLARIGGPPCTAQRGLQLSTLREPITVVVSRKSTNSGAAEPLVSLTTLSVTSVRGGSDFSVCRRGFFADRDHCCLYVITVSLIVIIEHNSCRAVVVVEFHHFRLPGHPGRWNQARYRTYQRPIQLTSSLGHDTHL